jgi:hypothetical protein
MHMPSLPHTPPFDSLTWQALALLQNCVLGQGAVTASQPAEQAVALAHWLLAQVTLVPGRQPPFWSQLGALVAMPFAQLGLPQVVCSPG